MEFVAKVDHGFKETFDKWNGKFLKEDSYDEVISSIGVKEDIIKISKPVAAIDGDSPPLSYIVKNAYTGKD